MIMRTKKQRAHVCHACEHVDSVVLEEIRASHLGYRLEVNWNGSNAGNRKGSNKGLALVRKGSVSHLLILMFNSRVAHPASKEWTLSNPFSILSLYIDLRSTVVRCNIIPASE